MEINDRIAQIISYYDIEQKELAEKIEVAAATISKIVKGLSIPGGKILIQILAQYPDISAEWLMRGNGNMLINQSKSNQSGETETTITQTQYQELLARIDKLSNDFEDLKNE